MDITLKFITVEQELNNDLQNHGDAVKKIIKNNRNKKDELEKFYNPRCSKCGYILYIEDDNEENIDPKLICKVCPMLYQI